MTTVTDWGERTTGTEVAERFKERINGRIVVITGVSPKSLGETLATALACHQPSHLILASRTKSKLEEVAKKITSDVKLDLVELNLSSQTAIRKAAAEIARLVDRIDIIINNAGVVTSERCETEDGLELQFGTNHIGHFLLTAQLTPLLMNAARHNETPGATRIVNVTSLGYVLSSVRFHDYNFAGHPVPPEEEPMIGIPNHMKPDLNEGRPYYGFTAYGQSKTCQILHAWGLNERLGKAGVRAFAVHPGSIWTDLSRNLAPEDLKVIEGTSTFWKTQDQGIATILVAALDPQLSKVEDMVFLSNCQMMDVKDHAKDPHLVDKLWNLSEKLTGESANL